MAVASMHLGVWSWSTQSPELQTECQILSVAGLSVSVHNLLSYWDFHTQPFLGFTKNGVEREKRD